MNEHDFHCRVLGIPADATAEQVKAAYRELVKILHPDRHDNSEAATRKFQELHVSYEYLLTHLHEKISVETSRFSSESSADTTEQQSINEKSLFASRKVYAQWCEAAVFLSVLFFLPLWFGLKGVGARAVSHSSADNSNSRRSSSGQIRYGMTEASLVSLIGTPNHSKDFQNGEVVYGYSGKWCVEDRDCFINVRNGVVIAYEGFKPQYVEDDMHKPKISIGMSWATLRETFGEPWRTTRYLDSSNEPIEYMLHYLGVICKSGKTCYVIVRNGQVVEHTFDPSYSR